MAVVDQAQAAVTRLLGELQGGNRGAINELIPLIYDELHALAHRQRRDWHGDYTVNTTALIHEAYLKLADQTHPAWQSRAHFLGVAAKAMRHVLIDQARSRRTEKRGGDVQKLSFEEMKVMLAENGTFSDERAEALLALEEALQRLEQMSERQSRIVECRFFGGMTIEETADALGLSTATVNRGWEMARTWLYREMQREMQ